MNGLNENKELSELMLKMFTLPFSNARIERDFSSMNFTKNKQQYKMRHVKRSKVVHTVMTYSVALFGNLNVLLTYGSHLGKYIPEGPGYNINACKSVLCDQGSLWRKKQQ